MISVSLLYEVIEVFTPNFLCQIFRVGPATGATLHGGFPKFFHKSLPFFHRFPKPIHTIQLWIGLGNRWKNGRDLWKNLGKPPCKVAPVDQLKVIDSLFIRLSRIECLIMLILTDYWIMNVRQWLTNCVFMRICICHNIMYNLPPTCIVSAILFVFVKICNFSQHRDGISE